MLRVSENVQAESPGAVWAGAEGGEPLEDSLGKSHPDPLVANTIGGSMSQSPELAMV